MSAFSKKADWFVPLDFPREENRFNMANAIDITFEPGMSLSRLLECYGDGQRILCHICNTPLVIAVTPEQAAGYNEHPGVFCPQDRTHVQIMTSVARDPGFWDQFKERK